MTEKMGNSDDSEEEYEDDSEGTEEEDLDLNDEEESESEKEPEKQVQKRVQGKERVTPQVPQPQVQTPRTNIDSDAVEMFNQFKNSALLLGVDEKKAESFAAAQALAVKAQMDKVKSRVDQAEEEQFNRTEYGEAMRQLKQAIPSLTKQQVKEFVDFKNQTIMESTYRNQEAQSDHLSHDEKAIAKLWGISEKDMKKELKRFNKIASMDMKDERKLYELGRIPV